VGRNELPNTLPTAFLSFASSSFSNHNCANNRVEAIVDLYSKFKVQDNQDFQRSWGYSLLLQDDPIFEEVGFKKQVMKNISHIGKTLANH